MLSQLQKQQANPSSAKAPSLHPSQLMFIGKRLPLAHFAFGDQNHFENLQQAPIFAEHDPEGKTVEQFPVHFLDEIVDYPGFVFTAYDRINATSQQEFLESFNVFLQDGNEESLQILEYAKETVGLMNDWFRLSADLEILSDNIHLENVAQLESSGFGTANSRKIHTIVQQEREAKNKLRTNLKSMAERCAAVHPSCVPQVEIQFAERTNKSSEAQLLAEAFIDECFKSYDSDNSERARFFLTYKFLKDEKQTPFSPLEKPKVPFDTECKISKLLKVQDMEIFKKIKEQYILDCSGNEELQGIYDSIKPNDLYITSNSSLPKPKQDELNKAHPYIDKFAESLDLTHTMNSMLSTSLGGQIKIDQLNQKQAFILVLKACEVAMSHFSKQFALLGSQVPCYVGDTGKPKNQRNYELVGQCEQLLRQMDQDFLAIEKLVKEYMLGELRESSREIGQEEALFEVQLRHSKIYHEGQRMQGILLQAFIDTQGGIEELKTKAKTISQQFQGQVQEQVQEQDKIQKLDQEQVQEQDKIRKLDQDDEDMKDGEKDIQKK